MKSIFSLLFITILTNLLIAQCPDLASTTANGCLELAWNTPPSPLPTIAGFTYSSGLGTNASPAIYAINGGCGANKGGFSGSFSISGGPTCTYSNGVLPITLKEFSVNVEKDIVKLNFSTLTELNNDYFTIEKSNDGVSFKSLGTILGAGNSQNLIKYEFNDEIIHSGISYYRIKQTDFDGNFSYSPVRSLRYIPEKFNIYFKNDQNSLYILTELESYTISIYNAAGHLVLNQVISNGDYSLDTNFLNKGLYFIRVNNGDVSLTHKIFL